MADWSSMQTDMLRLIARLLTRVGDHVTFASVSSAWRSAALEMRPDFPRPLPGLLLPGALLDSQTRCFFSLSSQKLWKQRLPVPNQHMCFGSFGGWLVVVSPCMDIHLLNPFSGARIALPPAAAFPNMGDTQLDNIFFLHAVAFSSCNPNANPKDLVVMVAEGEFRRLAFSKSGDEAWTVICQKPPHSPYHTIAFHKGQFYAASSFAEGIVVCDTGPRPKVTLVAPFPPRSCLNRPYLLDWLGELVLVDRFVKEVLDESNDNDNNNESRGNDRDIGGYHRCWGRLYKTVSFQVYKLKVSERIWEPVNSLGDHAFFLGYNNAYSISARDSEGCRGDCIYFTDDYHEAHIYGVYGGCDMGVYCLEDGSTESLYKSDGDVISPSPMWVTPLPW